MQADIITIGDEILIGQVVDTNSAWMAKALNNLGVQVRRISSISDSVEAITRTLDEARGQVDLVLMTGGLGPTSDDLTRPTLATYFQCRLRRDKEVLKHVTAIFERSGRTMPEVNALQADVLDIAEVLFNHAGTAPGMYIEREQMHYFIMPGVPGEMQHIMQTHILPRIQKMPQRKVLYHRTLLTAGLGESFLAEQIVDIEAELPQHMHLAYLPDFGQVRLRLSATGDTQAKLEEETAAYLVRIKDRLEDYWVSDDGSSLIENILNIMKLNRLSLSVAESCTGGHMAALITAIPGCSAVFKGGVIAYHRSVKETVLSVPAGIIGEYGVVSTQTAEAMARGARERFKSDYAVATTGIAGPDGGSDKLKVGTVCVAVAGKHQVISRTLALGSVRKMTIEKASIQGMILLRSLLLKEFSEINNG